MFLHNEGFDILFGLLLVDLLGLFHCFALLFFLVLVLLFVDFALLSFPLLIGYVFLLHELLLFAEPAGSTPLGDLLVQGSLPAGEVLIPILGPQLPLFPNLSVLAPLFL